MGSGAFRLWQGGDDEIVGVIDKFEVLNTHRDSASDGNHETLDGAHFDGGCLWIGRLG